MDRQEDRRGGILLKVSGQTIGNPGEAGTGAVIYHRNEKILEHKITSETTYLRLHLNTLSRG